MRASLLAVGLVLVGASVVADETAVLIDDFASADGRSTWGTSWQGFTDRVMGGLSDLRAGYREVDGAPVLFMEGQVRLENNGGFIQVRLPLAERGSFDASAWQGLRLTLRGRPGAYYLHLRTDDTRRPWAYYRAPLRVESDWQTLDLSFEDFKARSLRAALDVSTIRSLALVAYGERFDAELEVRRIEFLP